MSVPATRYRCTSCGNLTRFDVTSTRRTRAFHHFTVAGELEVEDVMVLAEDLESVECRWCGPSGVVVEVDAAAVAGLDAAGSPGADAPLDPVSEREG